MTESCKTQSLRFLNKVAVVTGGCCGIGRACADIFGYRGKKHDLFRKESLKLSTKQKEETRDWTALNTLNKAPVDTTVIFKQAEEGGKVAVLDVDDNVGSTLESVSTPGEMFYVHCDMTKEEEIKNAIERVAEKYGQIDCLVNNVGNHPGMKPIDEITVESFRDLLNLNLVSHFTASKYALPYLRKSKGSIVNLTSNSAQVGISLATTYCATKGGCLSLTKALAIDEAKHGVRVNSVSPACTNTPLLHRVEAAAGKELDEERLKYLGSLHLLNRVAQPREIGKACLFLAVDATFTTGAELMCTGGCEIGYGVKQ